MLMWGFSATFEEGRIEQKGNYKTASCTHSILLLNRLCIIPIHVHAVCQEQPVQV
jgi:hypothetical protein